MPGGPTDSGPERPVERVETCPLGGLDTLDRPPLRRTLDFRNALGMRLGAGTMP